MFKIGEFSKLSTISINMLRNYDEIGLLTPAYTDDKNGYRYYKEDQLPIANRIQSMKNMGIDLKTIKKLICSDYNHEELKTFLNIKLKEKIKEINLLTKQLNEIKNTLSDIDNKCEYAASISVKCIPKRIVASYKDEIEKFKDEGRLWEELYKECNKCNVEFSTPEYNIAIIHNANEKQGIIDVEVQKNVLKLYKDTEKVKFKEIKFLRVASLVFKGEYKKLYVINNYIEKWIYDNNYKVCGKLFNVYYINPSVNTEEENFITEVCIPISEKN